MNGPFAGCAALFLLATGRILIGVEAEYRSEAQQAHNTLTAAERVEEWQLLSGSRTTVTRWRSATSRSVSYHDAVRFKLSSPTRQTVPVAPKSR